MHLLNANYMFEILNRMLKRVILDLLLYFKIKIRKAVVKNIVPGYQKMFPIKQKSLHNKTINILNLDRCKPEPEMDV